MSVLRVVPRGFFPEHPTGSKSMTLKIFVTDLGYCVPCAHLHTDLKSSRDYLNQLTQEKELLLCYLKGDDTESLHVVDGDIIFERFRFMFGWIYKCTTLRYRVNTTSGRWWVGGKFLSNVVWVEEVAQYHYDLLWPHGLCIVADSKQGKLTRPCLGGLRELEVCMRNWREAYLQGL